MNEFLFLFLAASIGLIAMFSIWITIRLLDRYKERFLGYYLFYLIFQILFGFFAYIVPHIVRSFIFNQSNLSEGAKQVLQFFPFMAVPLVITGVFLYYLMFMELKNKKPSALFSVLYFGMQGGMVIITGLLFFKVPFLKIESPTNFSRILDMSYLGTDAAVSITVIISTLMIIKTLTYSPRKKMILNFSLIHLILKLVKYLMFIFIDLYSFTGIFYIALFLGGDIFPVLYLNVVLSDVIGTSAVAIGNKERMEVLSKREREIVDLICMGKSNKEIADTLFISIQTVKTHTYRVFRKLGIKNRVQLTNIVSDIKN